MPQTPRSGRFARFAAVALLAACVLGAASCGAKKQTRAIPPAPPPTFVGPAFLHGTVGSQATFRGMEPMLVSQYGLVVGLHNTGSAEVPAFLRQWLVQELRRQGVGSIKNRDIMPLSPDQLLASPQTSVVAVEGFIPPGATRGTTFDVLVSAIDTQTTSLQHGRLYTAELAPGGTNVERRFIKPLARAAGPLYMNPLDLSLTAEPDPAKERQAVVLAGGVVTVDRKLEILLNQPSWTRSAEIADRINERFPHEREDRTFKTAVARNDQLITLNVPDRFAGRPELLVNLINHLYLQRGAGFEPKKTQELADLLVADPTYARDVMLAWVCLGQTGRPIIRKYYDHPQSHVQLTALEAGVWLGDTATLPAIGKLAASDDPATRKQAAELLSRLPTGGATLAKLLDDPDPSVRISAYESVAANGDPDLLQRHTIGGKGDFKFILDIVPSSHPMIYVAQGRVPRIVIFDPMLGFKTPGLARLWDNRLMVRTNADGETMDVFYQPRGTPQAKTFKTRPTVANLIFLLAHKPDAGNPTDGLDLTYSDVVNALYQLTRNGDVPAKIEVQLNPIAQAIAKARDVPLNQPRPDTGPQLTPGTPATQPAANPKRGEARPDTAAAAR
jgi:hypothetical protein